MLAPLWTDQSLPGLRHARENVADGSIHLEITGALPGEIGTTVVYLIYAGPTAPSANPVFIATETSIDIPPGLTGEDWMFRITAANGSIESTVGLTELDSNLFAFPDSVILTESFVSGDGYVVVDSVAGFPTEAVLLIGVSLLSYSSTDTVDGYPAFIVTAEGFDGSALLNASVGAAVSLWHGAEAAGGVIKSIPACGLHRPEWIDQRHLGLERAEDSGDGYTVTLFWDYAVAPDGFSDIYYNIYKAESAYDLYATTPFAVSSSSPTSLGGIRPDRGYYFGVRATYFLADFNSLGMGSVGSAIAFPTATFLDGYLVYDELGPVDVESTSGYPNAGLLIIGREVLRYSSKTSTSFDLTHRDVFGLGVQEDWPAGQAVTMFRGVEDQNPYFWRMTTSWDSTGLLALPVIPGDGYFGNLYLQDDDGYRNMPVADLNENHDFVIDDAAAADPFDYCGLRSNDPAQFLSGDYCAPNTVHGTGTYHGNSMSGQAGGIDLFEGNLARQEMLLGVTGEPFILLRRKWTGKTCPRTSHRNEHPDARCGICLGTSFEGGYDRFINIRLIRPAEPNPNGFIQLRVSPYADEVDLIDTRGFSVEKTDITAWLPAVPTIRDRDILVRYAFDYETTRYIEEFRYEVTSVRRNKISLGKDGAQHVTMKRLNVTEEIYKFPVNLI